MWNAILIGNLTDTRNSKLRFAQAYVKVRTKMPGATVWNPAELDDGRDTVWYLRAYFRALVDDAAPGCVLVRMRGWNRDPMAIMLWALANCLSMPVVDEQHL